jgi:pimeloyl-ACP methyl ester carboxylesterase
VTGLASSGVDQTAALFEELASRFRGPADARARGRYRVSVQSVVRDLVIDENECRVERAAGRTAVKLRTDASTWARVVSGESSFLEAVLAERMEVSGSIDRALRFEPLFHRPRGEGLVYRVDEVDLPGGAITVLAAGAEDSPALLLLHGLGATKASWLPMLPALARDFRVLSVDLPGFGSSDKPRGAYDAPFFSERLFRLLDRLGVRRSFVAGNSMGGRIAMEMAMTQPESVAAVACLCPASAYLRRPGLLFVRLTRAELAVATARLPRTRVQAVTRRLFADPTRVPAQWMTAALDDFLRVWEDPAARLAFARAARSIYLEEPLGDAGFWTRLANMHTPALYLYGAEDRVITHRQASEVERVLPGAEVVVWEDCGHVPQLEHPERTAVMLADFFARSNEGERRAG